MSAKAPIPAMAHQRSPFCTIGYWRPLKRKVAALAAWLRMTVVVPPCCIRAGNAWTEGGTGVAVGGMGVAVGGAGVAVAATRSWSPGTAV